MAKNKGNKSVAIKQSQSSEKVVTKYDLKMQKRKEEAKKDARNSFIFKASCICIAIFAALAVVVLVGLNIYKVHSKYIVIGDQNVSEIEFDFYYGLNKNTILSQPLYGDMTYASYFQSYLGYDPTKDDKKQSYYSSEENSWYDYFANSTVSMIQENKALLKAAEEKGFTYNDADKEYEEFINNYKTAAQTANMSESSYYEQMFGSHASVSNTKQYALDYLKASAYSKKLQEELAPSTSEIEAEYNSNTDNYDKVDYRQFTVTPSDTTENTFEAAVNRAHEFADAATSEDTFKELCKKYASSDNASTYESSDASLMQGYTKDSMNTLVSTWLLNSSRKEKDVTVVEDKDNEMVYVVFFIKRYYNDSANEIIKSTKTDEKYKEFITPYKENLKLNNISNRIKMWSESEN